MISKDDDNSPPERDRTANRRWMIGLVLSLVFGIFGAVMALLSYMDRDRQTTTIYRNRKSPPAASPAAPGASPLATPPAAPAASPPVTAPAPSGDPAPAEEDTGKGNDKGDDKK